jgi:CO/xanthine dehydrogenase Mo-binding subunit
MRSVGLAGVRRNREAAFLDILSGNSGPLSSRAKPESMLLPTPSAAQDAKRRWSSGRRKKRAGELPCRKTQDLVSRPHLARNATCRPGSLASRVRVERGNGAVMVEKLTIVVDAGTVVDPDSALAQVEGGALWGLSMALHEGTEFVEGQVKDTNLDTYTPLRIGDAPELDIEFIDSTEVPVGLGEPATTVVGPAIGNAIFAAVGARLRHLPIRQNAVLQALAQ